MHIDDHNTKSPINLEQLDIGVYFIELKTTDTKRIHRIMKL